MPVTDPSAPARAPEVPRLGHEWSLHVADVATGRTLVDRHAAEPRMPASNMKIITAAAALITFGASHRFTSTAHLDGDGLVTVRGGGDPSFNAQAIVDIAAAVAERWRPSARLPRVMVDIGLYPPFTPAPGWSPDFLPYEVRPVVPLAPAIHASMAPHEWSGMQVAAAIGRRTGGAVFIGTGRVPAGAQCIARVGSERVDDLVRRMLLVSSSNVAEALARNVAIARGLPATWDGVRRGLEGAMRDAGFRIDGCRFVDGSGLSRRVVVRTELITDILVEAAAARRHPALGVIADALPVAGLTGTLRMQKGWFPDDRHAAVFGRVRAKTGTLRDVAALSGYVDHRSGRRSAFSVLVNGCDGWAAREAVTALVAGMVV